METPQPQAEHKWLQRLIGTWTFEGECSMGPDEPPMKNDGREVVEPLGELWTIGRMSGEVPEGGMCHSIMTLGFNPESNRFAGTFVTGMMNHLWIYNGALDGAGKTLTLDTEGPSFAEPGKMTRYQDIIELIDDDTRILRSQFIGPDGNWVPFMKSTYRRIVA